MAKDAQTGCPHCAELAEEIAKLKAELDRLRGELARAKKDSSNSSKPPSSDIVQPKQKNKSQGKGDGKARKRGGQKGHPKHERPAYDESEIDHFWDYAFSACPDCGGPVEILAEPADVLQQIELVVVPISISEHRAKTCRCLECRTEHAATLPEEIRQAGLIGPKLTALIAYLKGACHCSFSTIRKFVRDVLGVKLSRGYLAKLIRKASESLRTPYEQLLDRLPQEEILNVDETGHKDSGKRLWTWCFRASLYTLFKISPSRGSQVLLEVLGEEFDGVLGCDYFSAYRKYMKDADVLVQFCLAHLIRDVKFLVGHPEPRNRAYGRRVLEALRNLFAVIHRRESMSEAAFANQLREAGNILYGTAIHRVPRTREAENLAYRLDMHGESYIRFITTPGVEPTNNLAEQAIRFVVIDRKVTQGSRGEAGQRWLERIWTIIASCSQQGRSVYHFLVEAIDAHFRGRTAPILVPDTS